MTPSTDTQIVAARIIDTIENIDYVGTSPEFIIRLIPMFDSDKSDIADIAAIIAKEQSMAAQVLRLANSVYFSRGAAISTISQALVHLGLNIVKKMVIAFEMIDLCRDTNPARQAFESDLVKSSIAGAAIAEDLANKLGLKEKEEIYLCALLRDFGALIIKQYLPDIFKQIQTISQESKVPFAVACDKVCGFNHRYISFLLFSRWNLPSNVLSIFEQGSSRYGVWIIIENIIEQTDFMLKQHEFGQWDPFACPSQMDSDIFSLDEDDYRKSVVGRLAEVDDFLRMITDPRYGIQAA